MDTALENNIRRAAGLIRNSRCAIAFTGAGISVDSGMPTFRGQGGLWGHYDEQHLEYGFFLREPKMSWKTIREIFYKFTLAADPNDAHRILASWEERGIMKLIVTQNIDGLHSKAGSKAVAEFHGSCDTLICTRCGNVTKAVPELVAKALPVCECGGVYKPNFIFFGEGIPAAAYKMSFDAAARADVCVVIGSTGMVYPAASIPRAVKANGGAVIEINPEPSEFTDEISDVFIPLGAAKAMRAIEASM